MTALIGGPGDNKEIGAAWVFTRTGTTWTQQGAKAHRHRGGRRSGTFGESVALSREGNHDALIGGWNDNKEVGAAWVFTRTGTTWTQQGAKLTGKAGRSAQAKSAAKANSATAWRSPSKATPR